jgi:predicted lipoprotein with Yx(FWY)xxD motif
MRQFRSMTVRLCLLILAAGMLLASCGSSTSSTGTSSTTSNTSTSGSMTTTPTTASMPGSVVVKVATISLNGLSTAILTDTQGKTLYYFTSDTPTQSACTGGCASTWPPLLFQGSGSPQSASPLPGKLSVVHDAHGQQVAYNGHLLYRYAGDTAPGQAHGNGIGGRWFVAMPSLSVLATPTPGGSQYKY